MTGSGATISRNALIVASLVVALACFGLGFALTYESGTDEPVAQAVTTAPRETSTSSTVAIATTAVPTTVAPSTSPPTTGEVVTTAPATTASTTPPTTAPPVTAPSTPAVIEATYPRDGNGQMQVLEGAVSAVVLRNTGGTAGTFTVQGVGFVTVGATGLATGTLQPGEVLSVPIVVGTGVPDTSGPHATVSIFDALGLVASIPIVIT